MPTPELTEARQLLDELESRWISLFLWTSERTGITPEAMVTDLGENGTDALTNYESRRRAVPTGQFTPLHFLQFPFYVELAKVHRARLERLGRPPANWIRQLDQQNAKAVSYRNDLQHAGRFDLLTPAHRQEAVALFRQQLEALRQWWPDHPYGPQQPMVERNPLRAALQILSRDERSAVALAEAIGFDRVAAPVNLLAPGSQNALAPMLGDGFGRLYRVGSKRLANGSVGLYLAYLSDWPERSAARERYRRRLARALLQAGAQDARALVVMMDDSDGTGDARRSEIEIVYPRTRGNRPFGTVRAVVDRDRPTRYHVDLLGALGVSGATAVQHVTLRWNDAFNVEKVTNAFYREFKELRDQIGRALVEYNADHPALAGWTVNDLTARNPTPVQRDRQLKVNAFATRQLSRLLFLWFLQQKGWLGDETIPGPQTFLLDLFRARPKPGDTYFRDMLVPLFFDGLGEPSHHARHRAAEAALGDMRVPYIDGGLFRCDADPFERTLFGIADDGARTASVTLPDTLFDPVERGLDAAPRRGQARQRTVLGLLRSYRFTTQESTPDDQSVDPDPELLGKVFENLYQEDDRHETGAYYTPREIVRYMCRQALDGYVRDKTGIAQATLDDLRKEAVDWQETGIRLGAADESALNQALDEVTIVDPAVGSGAFLVGMLQEIVLLRRGIRSAAIDADVDRASDLVYDWKRHAITHSLYGVDINAAAVEICRLRLWLSLVIEYGIERLADVHPLPNLEFRVVAGDSLVDRMGTRPFRFSLPWTHVQMDFEAEQKYRELAALTTEYAEADRAARIPQLRTLAKRIQRVKQEIAGTELNAAIREAQANLLRVRSATPPTRPALQNAERQVEALGALQDGLRQDASSLKPLLWPLAFPRIFEAGGFDIVVANPPYVRQESLDASDQQAYAAAYANVYSGTADLYVFFFARAVQLLKPGGRLAFITSNKYMRAAYGEGLRGFLSRNLQLEQVTDFGDLPVFSVAAYPAVVIGQKVAEPEAERAMTVADLSVPIRKQIRDEGRPVNTEQVRTVLDGLDALIAAGATRDYPQVLLRRSGWMLEDPALVRLFERLMNSGTPLGRYVNGRIYRGVLTGLNEAFVIDQAKRDELIATDSASAELIKPWLRGRDIKRWKPDWAGLYVIFTRRGTDIDRYPAIRGHLAQWREDLEPKQPGDPRSKKGRKPGAYRWFEIQDNVAYWREIEIEKVIWPDISMAPRFSFDREGHFIGNTVYFSPALTIVEAALLNSSVGAFLIGAISPAIRGGYRRYFNQYVELFPLADVPTASKDQLIESASDRAQEQLDELATDIYRLTPAERRALTRYRENLNFLDNGDQVPDVEGEDESG